MPIRFRCAYCNQLLGIARRKAGTVVRCPNCAGQVVVPTLDEAGPENADDLPPPLPETQTAPAPPPATPAPAATGQQLFEGNEIDRLLEGAATDRPSVPANAAPSPVPVPAPSPAAVAPPPPPPGRSSPPQPLLTSASLTPSPDAPPGIYLSPGRATILSVVAVVALAISFGLGLLVGLFLHGSR
jgi:DNA-directed RNA polymerase subunit RPC12/RpoP